AVAIVRVTRIKEPVPRHEGAERLNLSARIILRASWRAEPVRSVIQPRKGTQGIAVAHAGARKRRNVARWWRAFDFAGQDWRGNEAGADRTCDHTKNLRHGMFL